MPVATHPALPAVLRVAPYRSVLPLGPSGRLVGLDPATALAVEDLSPPLAAMLDELHDPVETDQLVARAVARGADAESAGMLLRRLVAAGALVDAADAERAARHRTCSVVVVSGSGPLAIGILTGLAHAGVGTVHADTAGTVREGDLGTGYLDVDLGRERLDAGRDVVRRLLPAAATGPPPLRLTADLVVLADIVPEPERVAQLHASGTAHLAARLRDGLGIVGPLVLPGRSACLGCLELHRGDRDPAWPVVAATMLGRPGVGDPASAVATAALATAQALVALGGPACGAVEPATLDTTLELDLSAGTLLRRSWGPSPSCHCGAAAGALGRRRGPGHGPLTSEHTRDGDTITT